MILTTKDNHRSLKISNLIADSLVSVQGCKIWFEQKVCYNGVEDKEKQRDSHRDKYHNRIDAVGDEVNKAVDLELEISVPNFEFYDTVYISGEAYYTPWTMPL